MTSLLVLGCLATARAKGPVAGIPVRETAGPLSFESEIDPPPPEENAMGGMAEPPLQAPPSAGDAERRAHAIAASLRCPVCQGLSVADSPSEGAKAMHARVRELVAEGYSDEQVTEYFVDRYGDWILLEPPAQGANWGVWVGPVVFAAAGAVVVGSLLRRRRGTGTGAGAGAGERDAYRDRVLDELERR